MKKLFINLALLLVAFTSCQEAAKNKDVLMFTGTESTPVVKFVVENPSSMGVTVTATDKVIRDTKVKIAVDKAALEKYNKETGRSYVLPPDESYGLDGSEVLIKANQNVSEPLMFDLKSFEGFEEGKNYCVPISITSTDGEMPVLEASRTMYVVINRTIVSRAIDLRGSQAFNVPQFMTDPRVSALGAITMEIRVRANSFKSPGDNPGISSLMGIEENFLFRFGDISIDNDLLQLAPALVAGKKYYTTGETHYKPGKWYQVVCVYDGESVSIYVDGKLDVRFGAGPGTVNLNDDYFNGFWFGQSCGGRRLDGAISEARFWTRALKMQEIQDNACYVDPKTPGLLAYWRFNAVQEDGVTVRDETGNGFDAIATSSNISWIEGVRCPN